MINDLEEHKNYNVEISVDSTSGTQEENSEEKNGNVCVVENTEDVFYDISEETEHSSEQRNHEKNELNNFYDLTEVKGKKEEVICISSNSTNVVQSESSASSEGNGNEEKENLEHRDDQIVPIEVEPKHNCNIENYGDVCNTSGTSRNENSAPNGRATNGNNTRGGSHDEDNNDRNYNKEEKTTYVLCNICADIMEKSIFQDHLYAHTLEFPEKNEQSCAAYEKQKNPNNGLFDTRNNSFYTNFNSDRNKQNRCALKRAFNDTNCTFNNSEIILTDNNDHHVEEDNRIFDMIYNYNSNLDRFRDNPAVINRRNSNSLLCISEKKNNMVDNRNNLCNRGVSAQNIIEIVTPGENKVEDILSVSTNVEHVTRNGGAERNLPNKLEHNKTAVDNYLSAMRESLSAIFPDPNASPFENRSTSNNMDNYKNEEHHSSIINDIHSMISQIQDNVKRALEKSNNRVNDNSANEDINSFVNKTLSSILTDINDIKGTNRRNGKNDDSVDDVLNTKLKKIYQSLDHVNEKINSEMENNIDISGNENNDTHDRNNIVNSISGGILNRSSITIVNSTDGGNNGSEMPMGSVSHTSNENVIHMNSASRNNGNINMNRSNSYRDGNSSEESTNRGRQNNVYTTGPGAQEFNGRNGGSTFFHNQNVFSHESFFTGIPADSAHTYFSHSCTNAYNQNIPTDSGSINDINYLYSNLVDRYPCICENSGFSHFDNNSNNIWPLRRVTNNSTFRTSNDSPNSRLIKEANNMNINSNTFDYRNEGSNNGHNNIWPINNGRNTNNPFLFMANRHNRNIRSDVRTNQVVNTITNNYSFISTSRNSTSSRNANHGTGRIYNGNSNIGTTSIININNFNCVTTNNNYNNYNNNRTAAVGAPIGPVGPHVTAAPVGFPTVSAAHAVVNAAVMAARGLARPPGACAGARTGTIAGGGPCGQGVAPLLGPPTSTCSSRVSTTTVRANTEANLDPAFTYYVLPPRGASRTNRSNGANSNVSGANSNVSGAHNNDNINNSNITTNNTRNVNNGSAMTTSLSASSADDVTIGSDPQTPADNPCGANLRREQTLTRSNERTNRIVNRTTRGVANTSSTTREQPGSGNKKIGTRAKLKENNDYLIVHFDTKKNENNNLKICSICYENYQHNESLIFLPCTHNFHKACIIEWINKKSTCPICKINIKNF
ncbi:hypothetical protein AK88_00608 [Plasmodium fragile]|uniref:RING-type E3 ubiquitin transferase n=1 Tax=Plasmodium fragile TaxID=5857 RepID=A0A0D9QRD8_PLAFR|nr:uncharacterized protein AK88_00608 [Plasmodium fragile]KJP89650.1 hypothetical protein AK88_00608 [Plasmodium fragile]